MAKRKPKARHSAPSLAARRTLFLELLRQTGNISRSAREAALASSSVYDHRRRNAKFAADWDTAQRESLDDLEQIAIERAKHGVERPVYYRGEVCGSVRTYSDNLVMFLLRAKRPEIFARTGGATPGHNEMTEEEAKAEVIRRLDRLANDPEE